MTLLAVLSFALPADTDATPLSCDGKPVGFHMHRAHTLVVDAFDPVTKKEPERFLDPSPATDSAKRMWRAHKFCALDLERRERIGRMVDRASAKFKAFFAALLFPPGLDTLNAIAACESGGNHHETSNPDYRGKYQFSFSTWATVGGSGDPAFAPEREQDYRAAVLYRREGSAPWPVCGQ